MVDIHLGGIEQGVLTLRASMLNETSQLLTYAYIYIAIIRLNSGTVGVISWRRPNSLDWAIEVYVNDLLDCTA